MPSTLSGAMMSPRSLSLRLKLQRHLLRNCQHPFAKLTSDVEVGTSKIGDLAAAIATNETDLKKATAMHEKESGDFVAAEAELGDAVDTLGRAVGIIEREQARTLLHSHRSTPATCINSPRQLVPSWMQLHNQQGSDDDDDDDMGAPAPDSYKSHSGGILDVVADMKVPI